MKVAIPPLFQLVLSAALMTSPAVATTRGAPVSLLAEARPAAEARIDATLEARREVFVSTFIIGDEPFSLAALAVLRGAARSGLDVRLIVDAQWDDMPMSVRDHLLDEGVLIRRYHPFRITRPSWITRRLHDKLFIVDGRLLITGGRNVEAPYFGFGRQVSRRDYLDLDILVEGPVAKEARDYFLAVWESHHVSAPRRRSTDAEIRAAARELDQHAEWIEEQIGHAEKDGPRPELEIERVSELRFLHDPPEGKDTGPGTAAGLVDLVDGVQESLLIESAYVIPTRRVRRALAAAISRGARVRILTNSLSTTDNLWAQAGYVGARKKLVRAGVELWEYRGPESVHTKAGVIDGKTVIVGSFNLDPRSQRLNTEVALVVESERLAGRIRVLLDSRLDRSWRIDERGWPDGSVEPFPGVGWAKVCKLRMLQVLAPFIRSQL